MGCVRFTGMFARVVRLPYVGSHAEHGVTVGEQATSPSRASSAPSRTLASDCGMLHHFFFVARAELPSIAEPKIIKSTELGSMDPVRFTVAVQYDDICQGYVETKDGHKVLAVCKTDEEKKCPRYFDEKKCMLLQPVKVNVSKGAMRLR